MTLQQAEPDTNKPEQQFKGVWISAELWNDETLSPTAKFLIATIDSLCGPKGPCFASVEYLAARHHMTVGSMKNLLVKLTESKHLIRVASDGRKTWRCPNPRYWSDPGMAESWSHIYMTSEVISTVRGHKNVTSDVTNLCAPINRREKSGDEEGAQARNGAEAAPIPPPIASQSSSETESKTQHLNGAGPKPKPKPIPVFVPPALEQFGEYAVDKHISSEDAVLQFEEWKAGDWHDGAGNPIRSWKQKLLTFRNRGYLPSAKRAENIRTNNNDPDDIDEKGLNADERAYYKSL
jgi:hypothetical protein